LAPGSQLLDGSPNCVDLSRSTLGGCKLSLERSASYTTLELLTIARQRAGEIGSDSVLAASRAVLELQPVDRLVFGADCLEIGRPGARGGWDGSDSADQQEGNQAARREDRASSHQRSIMRRDTKTQLH
jgi:hypothetical protein